MYVYSMNVKQNGELYILGYKNISYIIVYGLRLQNTNTKFNFYFK